MRDKSPVKCCPNYYGAKFPHLHWTDKEDLIKALGAEQAQLWKDLVNADRALRKFSPEQLTKIIELYQNSSRKLTFE